MSKKGDAQKQVRLEPEVEKILTGIRLKCPWPTSLNCVANFALRWGLAHTRRTFNGKK